MSVFMKLSTAYSQKNKLLNKNTYKKHKKGRASWISKGWIDDYIEV